MQIIMGNPHRSGADAGNFSAFPHRKGRETKKITQIGVNNSNSKSNQFD